MQEKFAKLQPTTIPEYLQRNFVDFHRSYFENSDPEVNRKNRLLLQSLWKDQIQEDSEKRK